MRKRTPGQTMDLVLTSLLMLGVGTAAGYFIGKASAAPTTAVTPTSTASSGGTSA